MREPAMAVDAELVDDEEDHHEEISSGPKKIQGEKET